MKFRSLLGCSLLVLLIGCQVNVKNGNTQAEADSTGQQAVPVAGEQVARGDISSYLHLNGVLATEEATRVFPLVSGHVARLLVEEGDHVQQGDTLLVLEDAELQLTERRARLDYDKAQADCTRLEELSERVPVARQDLDDARYASEQARLNWESAALQVRRSRVTAPIRGVIAERLVRTGDFVTGNTHLFSLVDDRELISVLDVPERELSRLRIGQAVEISALADKESHRGRIRRIAPVVDSASGTVRVTVALEGQNPDLRAGMYARFAIVTATHENALLVPKRALVYDRERALVFVAADTSASRRLLERGFETEDYVEALGGVSEQETLVVVGQSGLKDGAPIKLVELNGITLNTGDKLAGN